MSSSVEQIQRGAVFFAACSSVVDVTLVKFPVQNQLQVVLFEPTIGADVPRLCLDYGAVVKRLGKNAEQAQMNVVLDSSTQCTDVAQIRTSIRNKAMFDFVVSGLTIVYDAKEMRILKVGSKFESKPSNSHEADRPRSLSRAANRVASFIGRVLSVGDGDVIGSKMESITVTSGAVPSIMCKTSSVAPDITNTNTTSANNAGTEHAEPNKYMDANGSPARRLARFLLARANNSSRQLTDSNLTLTTEAVGSGRADTPLTCTSPDPQQLEPQTVFTATIAGDSSCMDGTNTCTRFHPAMPTPVFAKHLTVNTDLSVDLDYDEESGDVCDDDCEGESSGEESGDGESAKQEGAHGLLGCSAHATASCPDDKSAASIKTSEAPTGATSSKAAKQKPVAVAAKSPSSISWWLNALVSRLSTKRSAVHVE